MQELLGNVSSSDEETEIEPGIDFTKSSMDGELLGYLEQQSPRKVIYTPGVMKKLVMQKQEKAKKLETQKRARKASSTVKVTAEVHHTQKDLAGPSRLLTPPSSPRHEADTFKVPVVPVKKASSVPSRGARVNITGGIKRPNVIDKSRLIFILRINRNAI